jgi:hypothetical protein
MDRIQHDVLRMLAGKYIWWKTPDEALAMPERVIAQVMNIGDYDDVVHMVSELGDDVLRDVLKHAQAGQFNARSWAYWHFRLDITNQDELPALPTRKFA